MWESSGDGGDGLGLFNVRACIPSGSSGTHSSAGYLRYPPVARSVLSRGDGVLWGTALPHSPQ